MKCTYCGKELKGKVVTTAVYAEGKLVSVFCNPGCMGRAYKKMARLIKKMSREELLNLINANREEEK